MQVPNGTGPGLQRSKRPLLASRTRCDVLWKPPKFGYKVKIGIKANMNSYMLLQMAEIYFLSSFYLKQCIDSVYVMVGFICKG